MNKTIFITGIAFGALAILLGAFGAHGLKALISAENIITFETGVKYQMYHAFFLLILSLLKPISAAQKKSVFICILLGIIFFSFSIYALATNALTPFNFKTIALITPVGGLLLLTGWVLLGVHYWKAKLE